MLRFTTFGVDTSDGYVYIVVYTTMSKYNENRLRECSSVSPYLQCLMFVGCHALAIMNAGEVCKLPFAVNVWPVCENLTCCEDKTCRESLTCCG